MRSTEAVVDLGAIGRNVERLLAHAAPAELCVVTKADGYGHGSVAVARAALDAGATWVAVALVEEGIELRRSGLRAPILLLSEPRPGEMFEVVEAGLTPTAYSPVGIAALVAAAGTLGSSRPIDVHLNIDTGMNRVGVRPDGPFFESAANDRLLEAVRGIVDKSALHLSGVWTHFAVADEPDRPETSQQLERFRVSLDAIADYLGDDVVVHASNSAGLLARPDARFDMVRVGIATYGIAPSHALEGVLQLEPAMSLHTAVSMVKTVRAGEGISYGLRHVFAEDTAVATIPIGYADGLRRDSWKRGVHVLVGGERRPIVGVVTMDQAMIDLGPTSAVQPGEEVVLIGEQGAEKVTVSQASELLDTIPYEIICDIGRRVRRRYL